METEPTLLFKIFDFILQVIVFFVAMGIFAFICFAVDAFIRKGLREMSPFDSGWTSRR